MWASKFISKGGKFLGVAAVLAATLASLPGVSHASLRCEEIVEQRNCTDNGTKPVGISGGSTYYMPAPVIPGFDQACWSWNRKFRCVETNPIYTCESGADFDTVKRSCSLTGASTLASTTINSLTYITDARYTYRCGFGEWESDQALPGGRECVVLSQTGSTESVAAAPTNADPSSGASLSEQVVVTERQQQHYVCYAPPVTSCSDVCYENVKDPATGTIERREVACNSPVTNCAVTSNQCTNATGTSPSLSLGPDGRCVNSQAQYLCQSGPIPRCLTQDSCTLQSTTSVGVLDNGMASQQEQTYQCTNETRSCAEMATVSNCVSPNAWGWDQMGMTQTVGDGLAEANAAMAKVEGMRKGVNEDDIYIFSGQDLRCHYAVGNFWNTVISVVVAVALTVATGGAGIGAMVGLTAGQSIALSTAIAFAQDASHSKAFGGNCCKELVVEGSDTWYKLGKCTADEVKLAVAKQKQLTRYLGEYCSKKGGFPLKQCVEKTRSYCVFDDMLALTVNEQGRQQLDALASADTATTTVSGETSFQLFSAAPSVATPKYKDYANGSWQALGTFNKSQVRYWQYPSYCASTAQQQAAYELYQAEITAAADMRGIDPTKVTQAQLVQMLNGLDGLAEFQECASVPGEVPFLTCSRQDDNCDAAKLPDGPQAAEIDMAGENVSTADPSWRVQLVRSFYTTSSPGVTQVMANTAYAAVTTSVSAFVSAIGSCHTDGACLYKFSVTDKTAQGGAGAKLRSKETLSFPLYTLSPSPTWPAVTFVQPDGTLDNAAWTADPNRGLGTPMTLSNQRFIVRPHLGVPPSASNPAFLMEWAHTAVDKTEPQKDFSALLVPTTLPQGTPGWWPYGDATDNKSHFYFSGGCNSNSRWCSYEAQVDLSITRHPWGTAQEPRCWGFTVEQLSVLDFDKMDLSRWINSLDLDTSDTSGAAAAAMAEQSKTTAESFYTSFKSGATTQSPNAGTVALVLNADTLPNISGADFEAYTVTAMVPSNWPSYFTDQPNNNPVTNVRVNWGDDSAEETMVLHPAGRGFTAKHDFGDKPAGSYRVKVTLNTANNGAQTLSSTVSITPDNGGRTSRAPLSYSSPGMAGKEAGTYTPSNMPNGNSQAPANLGSIAPATKDQFDAQGNKINKD